MSPGHAEREALIRALVEVCDERGYAEATPRLLEHRAGLAAGDFHRAYRSLEDCFLELWDRAYEEEGGKILAAYAGGEEWTERLDAAAEELLRLLRKRRDPVLRVLVLASDRAGERAAGRRDRFVRSLAQLIDAGRFEPGGLDGVPAGAPALLAGSIQHAVYSRLIAGRPAELERLKPELMSLVVTFYRGRQAGMAQLAEASG